MSIADKVRIIYGIRRFLEKYETNGNIEKDWHINPIFIRFATDMGWVEKFAKSNKKGYRGRYEPSLDNAGLISANFRDFKTWVNKNYAKRELNK